MNFMSKRTLSMSIAFLIIILSKVMTPFAGLSESGLFTLGIFAGCLILWMTESIDWPSILCIFLVGLLPEIGLKAALITGFGSDTFAFLLFTFLCTHAISKTPFLKRCAIFFINSPIAKKGPWPFVISFFASVILIGCFMSPTVLFIIFLPILEEVNRVLGLKKGDKIAEMLIIGLAFATSISAGMTPIAHVFSVMALGFYETATGLSIAYADYMIMAVPVGLLAMAGLLLIFRFVLNPDMSSIKSLDMSSLNKELDKVTPREIYTISVFAFVVFLWIVTGISSNETIVYISSFGSSLPPLLGVLLLSIPKFDGETPLNFTDAMKNGVPWASLIMAAGTLVLGSALTSDTIGIKQLLIDVMNPILLTVSPMVLVLIFVSWACLQTNLSSNMVTVTVVTNIAIPILIAANGSVNTAAVVSLIGMMGAYAFATPPSMPHIAISAGSGWTTTTSLLKYGLMFMVITIILSVLVGYPLGLMFM